MAEWLQNPFFLIAVMVTIPGALIGIGIWVGHVNSDRSSFKVFMKEVRDDFKTILQRLPERSVSGHSPVQLTEFGKKISQTIDAPGWARKQAPKLVNRVKGKEEFEVFDACIAHVAKAYKDPGFTRIVRAGAYGMGTDPDNVLQVYNVELRDHVMKLLPQ